MPEMSRPGAVLLFKICVRLPPAELNAETEPASSRVAPNATEAVTPDAIVVAPATLNISVPAEMVVLPLYWLAPAIIQTPTSL